MEIVTHIYSLLVVSIVVASIAWTVTQEEIFREWHDFCKSKCEDCTWIVQRKFFYVFTCEYCFSHWVAMLVIALTGFRLLLEDWRGYVVALFVTSWLANQWMSLYRRLRVDIKKEDAVAKKIQSDTIEAEAIEKQTRSA